jgi:Na+/proline symporter
MDLGFFGNMKDDSLKLKWIRHSTLFWGVVLIIVAYLSREVESVMNAAFSLVGLTSGALLGGVVLSLLIKRGPAWPVVFGMVFSLFSMIWINWLKFVHWPWYTLIGFCIMVFVSLSLFRFAKRL